MGIGAGSMFKGYKPDHFTLLFLTGGVVTLTGVGSFADGLMHQPEDAVVSKPVGENGKLNLVLHLLAFEGGISSYFAARLLKIKDNTRLILLASSSVLSLEAGAFSHAGAPPQLRLESVVMSRKTPQYAKVAFASSYDALKSSSKNMKELFENTMTAAEFKQMNREAERQLATTSSKIVDPSGKLLNDDFIQLAFLSEHLQGNKSGFNTKEFVKEVQIAATLPYDLPMAEFEAQRNKFKDPVAKNIFINRRAFRQMGWM